MLQTRICPYLAEVWKVVHCHVHCHVNVVEIELMRFVA